MQHVYHHHHPFKYSTNLRANDDSILVVDERSGNFECFFFFFDSDGSRVCRTCPLYFSIENHSKL